MTARLRLVLLLLPPAFAIAFVIMLPALIRSRVPVRYWPTAVLYGLFVGGRK